MIRVATYNILHGHLKGMEGIAATLAGIDADLIGLQEVDRGVERSGHVDQAAELGERLGLHHVFEAALPWGGGLYGLAILSRFEIVRRHRLPLPSRAMLSLADGSEPRILLEAEVEIPESRSMRGPLRFAVTHLGLDPTERILQASLIARRLGGAPRTILCGDFNTGRTEPAFAWLDENLVDCIHEAGRAPLRSYPADVPTIAIDHVFRSSDLAPTSRAWSVFSDASDHLPIVVDLG